MHPEIKARGVGIIKGFNPGQDRPRDGTAVFALFGGTIHVQGLDKRTKGDYPEM